MDFAEILRLAANAQNYDPSLVSNDPNDTQAGGEFQRLPLITRPDGTKVTAGGQQVRAAGGTANGLSQYALDVEEQRKAALAAAMNAISTQYGANRNNLQAALQTLAAVRDRTVGQYERARDQAFEQVDDQALTRGVLRSGIRERNRAEAATPIAEAIAALQEDYASQRREMQSQIDLMSAQEAAAAAAKRTEIEQQFLNVAESLKQLGLLAAPAENQTSSTNSEETASSGTSSAPPKASSTSPKSSTPSAPSRPRSSGSSPSLSQAVRTVAPPKEQAYVPWTTSTYPKGYGKTTTRKTRTVRSAGNSGGGVRVT